MFQFQRSGTPPNISQTAAAVGHKVAIKMASYSPSFPFWNTAVYCGTHKKATNLLQNFATPPTPPAF